MQWTLPRRADATCATAQVASSFNGGKEPVDSGGAVGRLGPLCALHERVELGMDDVVGVVAQHLRADAQNDFKQVAIGVSRRQKLGDVGVRREATSRTTFVAKARSALRFGSEIGCPLRIARTILSSIFCILANWVWPAMQ